MIERVKGSRTIRSAQVRDRQGSRVKGKNRKIFPFLFLLVTSYWLLVTIQGCGPTYPKGQLKESIVALCKREYKLDVKVETIGKTIVLYAPLENLIDFSTFSLTQNATDKINDVIMSVTRVALSTDAKFDFYCVIVNDVRFPEVQIVIIKSVDDVKRFLLSDISRGEFSKRSIIDRRLNPQAQKEHAIKDVFDRMNLDKKWQDQVMNDFFRATPTALGDIGYWNGSFYIKDVTLAEFLAEQIANRIRLESVDDKELSEMLALKSSRGSYLSKDGRKYFKLEISAEPKWAKGVSEKDVSDRFFQSAAGASYQVIRGYKFQDFDYIEIVDETNGKTLRISNSELDKFKPNKGKIEDMMVFDAY